jgi:hypothetical protein
LSDRVYGVRADVASWPINDTRASRLNVHCALLANIPRAYSIVADAVLRAVRSYVEREADGADIGSVATKNGAAVLRITTAPSKIRR